MDKLKFEYEMKRNGYSYATLSKKLGICRSALYRKASSKTQFTLKEMQDIMIILNLNTPVGIFFEEKVS